MATTGSLGSPARATLSLTPSNNGGKPCAAQLGVALGRKNAAGYLKVASGPSVRVRTQRSARILTPFDTRAPRALAAGCWDETGAGEEIRTLDPHVGNVM